MGTWKRDWTGPETRLLAEWLASRYPRHLSFTHVRVGPIAPATDPTDLDEGELAILGAWRRWADAIVIDPPDVVIVEASVLPVPGKLAALELYLRLFPLTPEFADYRSWPRRGVLLYGVTDPILTQMALERGFTVDEFSPEWLGAYLALRLPGRLPPAPAAV